MKLLDLFCGEGGAGFGYQRIGFDVFGVDNSPARRAHYPFANTDGDALLGLTLLVDGSSLNFEATNGRLVNLNLADIDAIHASPPCTGYSRGTASLPDRLDRYDRLIPAVRDLLEQTGKPWVIENVDDAKSELRNPLMLCWTHFRDPGSVIDDDGTPLWMKRHRLFESNIDLWPAGECNHRRDLQCAGAYGGARRDKDEARYIRKGGYVPSLPVMRELLGTPWMTEKGCQLSIPPAYASHIGAALLAHIESEAAA